MKFLTFDIESCTGNPYDGSLCSFGYILTDDDKIISKGDILVNPLPQNFTLGKFGEEPRLKLAYPVKHFRMQPRFNGRYCEIKALFEEADVALGFAVQNDIKYVNNACDKFSLPRIPFKFLDVQMLMGLILPEMKNLGLKAAADRYGIEFLEHRSDEDARVTFEVFLKLLEEAQKSLGEIMADYGIMPGVNTQEGHRNCYSKWQAKERVASNSKSSRKILIHYYGAHSAEKVKVRGDKFKNKFVAVSDALSTQIELARKVIATTVAEGGYYESSIAKSDFYVTVEGDNLAKKMPKINPSCKVLLLKDFEALCGGLTDCSFNDQKIMEEHYTALITDTPPVKN